MTVTDDRYEKILKAFESDPEFDVPKVAGKREASNEDWMDDGITLKDLMKARKEDSAGVVAKNYFEEHHAVEDYDVLSLSDLLKIQKEEEGIMAKKFNGKNQYSDDSIESIATEGEFKCPKCSFSTDDDDAWSYHMQDHDDNSAMVSDFMKYEMESKATELKYGSEKVDEIWRLFQNDFSSDDTFEDWQEYADMALDMDEIDAKWNEENPSMYNEAHGLYDQNDQSSDFQWHKADSSDLLKTNQPIRNSDGSISDYNWDGTHNMKYDLQDQVGRADHREAKSSEGQNHDDAWNAWINSPNFVLLDRSKWLDFSDELDIISRDDAEWKWNIEMGVSESKASEDMYDQDSIDGLNRYNGSDYMDGERFGDRSNYNWSDADVNPNSYQQVGDPYYTSPEEQNKPVPVFDNYLTPEEWKKGNQPWQDGGEVEDKDDTDKVYDKLIESFEDSTMDNQNQGFKSDIDDYGVADLNADRKGNNMSKDFWSKTITTDDEATILQEYNPEPNAQMGDYNVEVELEVSAKDFPDSVTEVKKNDRFLASEYGYTEGKYCSADTNLIKEVCSDNLDEMKNHADITRNFVVDEENNVIYNPHNLPIPKEFGGTESLASEMDVSEDQIKDWLYDWHNKNYGVVRAEQMASALGIDKFEAQNWIERYLDHIQDEQKYGESKASDESLATEDDFNYEFDELSSLAQDKIEDTDVTPSQWNETPVPQREQLEDAIANAPEQYDSMGDVWQCPECGFKTGFQDEYNDHEKSHKGLTESDITEPYDNILNEFSS